MIDDIKKCFCEKPKRNFLNCFYIRFKVTMRKSYAVLVLLITLLSLLCITLIDFNEIKRANRNFDRFDNEAGSKNGCYIVPNVVHFLRFNNPVLKFPEAVCLLAAFKNQRPEKIMIHTNVKQTGKYWKTVKSVPGLDEALVFVKEDVPKEIFGQKLNPGWKAFHGSDVTRIKILMEYGGIFLDNDSYIVRSLDSFRRFEMTLGWQPGKLLQNQVVVAHKDARFLKLWLESYRDRYKPTLWYYNAGELPTKILEKRPFLVHREPKLFGVYGVVRKIFETPFPEWRTYYAFHLMVRHQYLFKNISKEATYPVNFNEKNIVKYPIAFRDMVYDVYPFKTNIRRLRPKKSKIN